MTISRVTRRFFAQPVGRMDRADLIGYSLEKRLQESGFDQGIVQPFVLVVREIVTNVIKYADHGDLVIEEIVEAQDQSALRCRMVDYGPGIGDIEQAMRAGFSSASTLGVGLPTIFAQSDDVAIIPRADGTTVEVRKFIGKARNPCVSVLKTGCGTCAVKTRPYTVFTECGDCGVVVEIDEARTVFALWDVEGHGSEGVYRTSLHIRKYIRGLAHFPVQTVLQILNESILRLPELKRSSIVIGESDCQAGSIQWYQLGNVEAAVIGADRAVERFGDCPGVLGLEHVRPRHRQLPLEQVSGLVLFTDGVDLGRLMKVLSGRSYRAVDDAYWLVDVLLRGSARSDDDAGILLMVNGS